LPKRSQFQEDFAPDQGLCLWMGASAGAKKLEAPKKVWDPYNRGLGAKPQQGPRADPLVRTGRRNLPPEAETLLAFGRSLEAANLSTLKNWKRKKSDTICVVFAKNEV